VRIEDIPLSLPFRDGSVHYSPSRVQCTSRETTGERSKIVIYSSMALACHCLFKTMIGTCRPRDPNPIRSMWSTIAPASLSVYRRTKRGRPPATRDLQQTTQKKKREIKSGEKQKDKQKPNDYGTLNSGEAITREKKHTVRESSVLKIKINYIGLQYTRWPKKLSQYQMIKSY